MKIIENRLSYTPREYTEYLMNCPKDVKHECRMEGVTTNGESYTLPATFLGGIDPAKQLKAKRDTKVDHDKTYIIYNGKEYTSGDFNRRVGDWNEEKDPEIKSIDYEIHLPEFAKAAEIHQDHGYLPEPDLMTMEDIDKRTCSVLDMESYLNEARYTLENADDYRDLIRDTITFDYQHTDLLGFDRKEALEMGKHDFAEVENTVKKIRHDIPASTKGGDQYREHAKNPSLYELGDRDQNTRESIYSFEAFDTFRQERDGIIDSRKYSKKAVRLQSGRNLVVLRKRFGIDEPDAPQELRFPETAKIRADQRYYKLYGAGICAGSNRYSDLLPEQTEPGEQKTQTKQKVSASRGR